MYTFKNMLSMVLVCLFCWNANVMGQDIYQAIRDNNLELVKKSLQKSPDLLNQKNNEAFTPLNLAAEQNRPEIAAYLLKMGADPSIGDNENSQPIHLAAISGSEEIIDLLLKHGVDINTGDDNGMTPLHFALSRRQLTTARHLVNIGANVNAQTTRSWSPLLLTVIAGSYDDVKFMIENKADVNDRIEGGMTPVHTAASYGKLDVVELLAENGAKLDLVTDRNENILFWTRNPNCAEVVEYLIDQGLSVRHLNERKETPLHYIAGRGLAENVATLYLENGADVNAMDEWGRTPLHMTSWSRNPEGFSKFLILNGANVNPVNCASDKAICCGANFSTPLHGAARMGNLGMMKNLVSNGAKVNVYDGQGLTPLHWAVQSGSAENVEYLIDHGAFLNTPEKNLGSSELHLAVSMGYGDITDILVESGSDILARDNNGRTPLDYAWKYSHKDIAYHLLADGADDENLKEHINSPNMLKEDVAEGEAMVWFLGHSGWAVKTQNHFLVFDYFCDRRLPSPDDSCLASGYIVPEELGYEDVTVFSTHRHGDHYDENIFTWREDLANINYVLCWTPPGLEEEYEYIPVHESREIDGMDIYVNYSTDIDGGYLVEVDGLTIWHMGDHANGEDGLMTAFTDEVDLVAGRTDKIDILFGGIRGCSLGEPEQVKRGLYYTLEKLQPELFIPMHAGSHSFAYKDFVDEARADGIDQHMKYPVHKGDFFLYKREKNEPGSTDLID